MEQRALETAQSVFLFMPVIVSARDVLQMRKASQRQRSLLLPRFCLLILAAFL